MAINHSGQADSRRVSFFEHDQWATHYKNFNKSTDPQFIKLFEAVKKRAEKYAREPVITDLRKPDEDPKRILTLSHECFERILYCGIYNRLLGGNTPTNDAAFGTKAIAQILAACDFRDWNESHFLDTAEMMTGVALGYDLMYPYLTNGERKKIENAISDKGLKHYNLATRWFDVTNNWNAVVICGLVTGYFAIQHLRFAKQNERIDLIKKNLEKYNIAFLLEKIKNSVSAYRGGSYAESLMYWEYATAYLVICANTVKGAVRSGFSAVIDLSDVKASGDFRFFATSPNGKNYYNYADGTPGQQISLGLTYISAQAGNTQFDLMSPVRQLIDSMTADEIAFGVPGQSSAGKLDRFSPLVALLWPSNKTISGFVGKSRYFSNTTGEQPLFLWRNKLNDPNSMWFGIKGGRARTSHGHMDAGSFILDCDGVRWAVEPGSINYADVEDKFAVEEKATCDGKQKALWSLWNLSQHGRRWSLVRMSDRGHNTISMGTKLGTLRQHNVDEAATCTLNTKGSQSIEYLVDLTNVFKGHGAEATNPPTATCKPAPRPNKPTKGFTVGRAVRVPARESLNPEVVLTDTFEIPSNGAHYAQDTVYIWRMNTLAEVEIFDNRIKLTQHGKTFQVSFRLLRDKVEIDSTEITKLIKVIDMSKEVLGPGEGDLKGLQQIRLMLDFSGSLKSVSLVSTFSRPT